MFAQRLPSLYLLLITAGAMQFMSACGPAGEKNHAISSSLDASSMGPMGSQSVFNASNLHGKALNIVTNMSSRNWPWDVALNKEDFNDPDDQTDTKPYKSCFYDVNSPLYSGYDDEIALFIGDINNTLPEDIYNTIVTRAATYGSALGLKFCVYTATKAKSSLNDLRTNAQLDYFFTLGHGAGGFLVGPDHPLTSAEFGTFSSTQIKRVAYFTCELGKDAHWESVFKNSTRAKYYVSPDAVQVDLSVNYLAKDLILDLKADFPDRYKKFTDYSNVHLTGRKNLAEVEGLDTANWDNKRETDVFQPSI